MNRKEVKRYERLRPDQLAECLQEAPIVFWPLGLLEHHGWHLPVGFDGLKAEQMCIRIAENTGGVLLPVMWWGADGGHGDFLWTHYQSRGAATAILKKTLEQLVRFGFRVFVLLAGHYPWQGVLESVLPAFAEDHPDLLFLWGTEMSIAAPATQLSGDHAAQEETSYGLALFPELVDLNALRSGRTNHVWLLDGPPAPADRHPGVCFEPTEPNFAQMGVDAALASAERGEVGIASLVEALTQRISDHLHEV